MQDVYRCTIDGNHLASKILEAELMVAERCGGELRITIEDHAKHFNHTRPLGLDPSLPTHASTPFRSKLQNELDDLGIKPHPIHRLLQHHPQPPPSDGPSNPPMA